MSTCRGCVNEFVGHSPDQSGIFCEHCGTKNFKETSMSCKIDVHLIDADGQHCECQYLIHLSREHLESLAKLLNDEVQRNIENGDDAYNTHWQNTKMALGYAITK